MDSTFAFGKRRRSRRSRRRSRRGSMEVKVRKSRRSRRSGRRGNPNAKKAMKIAVEMAAKKGGRPSDHLRAAWAMIKGGKGGKRGGRRRRGSKKAFGAQIIPGF